MWKREELDFGKQQLSRKSPTGIERYFDKDELIVSKTDTKGKIVYTNEVFQRISGYTELELLGQPHCLIRHPEMPRIIFKLLWDYLQNGKEIFAYVNNLAKNGDNYWVMAHITPSLNDMNEIVGFHSNRRVPNPQIVQQTIVPLYKQLLAIENGDPARKTGLKNAEQKLKEIIAQKGTTYDEFILSI